MLCRRLCLNKDGLGTIRNIPVPGVTLICFLYSAVLKEVLLVSGKCFSDCLIRIAAFHVECGFFF